MKKLLHAGFLFVVSLVCQQAIAQNYQPFRKGLTYHFISQDSIYSMRIDSAKVVAGDSVFVFNQTVKKIKSQVPGLACTPSGNLYAAYQPQKNNQFGSQIIKKQNGDYIFRTIQGQEFLLKTKAAINQSWNFNSTANLSVTLTAKAIESLSTTSDSVYTYSLSNGKQIKLSKNFGFITTPNFVTYADSYFKPKTLQFYALPEKGLGSKISEPFQIYDFVVGDKFMYYLKSYDSSPIGQSLCIEEWKQYEVMNKRISANGDSIYYSLKLDRLQKGYGSPNAPTGMCQTPTGSTIFPPFIETLIVTKRSPENLLTLSNSYFSPSINYYNSVVSEGIFKKSDYNFREQLQLSYYEFKPCANAFIGRVDNGIIVKYGVGIGKTYESKINSTETLIAYVKGTETYGRWQSLQQILAIKKELETKPLVKAFPNPFASELTISFGGTSGNIQLTILNTLGQTVWQKETSATANSEIKIAMPELAKGLYFLQASQNGKVYTSRLVRE